MKDKPTVVPFTPPDEMRGMLENLKRTLPIWKEQAAVLAEIRKASYDAHIAQGFTPEQAIDLCRSMLL